MSSGEKELESFLSCPNTNHLRERYLKDELEKEFLKKAE
jgi:hypothetical protein